MTLAALLAGLLAAQAPAGTAQPPATFAPGDRVVVTDDQQSIRGRIAAITADELVLDDGGGRLRLPLPTVHQIDRVGDSLLNGTAIGAALGGGTALVGLAKACINSNCSDIPASLAPRLALLGALGGAGLGVLIDAAIERRKTVYRAGSGQLIAASRPPERSLSAQPWGTVFARAGRANLADDEGSLGSGATFGAGVVVPLGRRFGVQVAYDRHTHRRDFERDGPPNIPSTDSGFTGTEQLVTMKTLIFFRPDKAVRPYAGIGGGWLDSTRVSTFPTYFTPPGGIFTVGSPEIFRYHSRDFGLGFATGFDARMTRRFSIVSDLTIDLSSPSALSSTRLTAGVGWHVGQR